MDSDSDNEYEEDEEYDDEEHFLDSDNGEEEAGEEEEEEGEEEEGEEEEEESEEPSEIDPSSSGLKRFRKMKALVLSKYNSVWDTTELLGWKAYGKGDARRGACNLCWTDSAVGMNQVMKMGRMQKINHFPGMFELVRKAGTARNLNKMLKAIGKEYKVFPQTFMLPADYTELKKEWEHGKSHGNKTFIVKPSKGCQGNGIRLTRCLDDISPHEPNIVQRYMHRPHLLDGYKYDLRLYVLLTSIEPLRCFLFREGLVRVCTQKYAPLEKNMGDVRMHLTNYSINKDSENFVQPEDGEDCADAHKRTVSSLMRTLEAEGHDTERLWQQIGEVCVKTLISVQAHLEHQYASCRGRADDAGSGCFELLGFDIMFDYKLRPFLLEVNHTPSFRCDSPLDSQVKMAALKGTMEMVSFCKAERALLRRPGRISAMPGDVRGQLRALREAYELHNADRLGFDTIYPPNAATCGGDEAAAAELRERYDAYLAVNAQLFAGMGISGSRRQAHNCSTSGPKSTAPSPHHGHAGGGLGSRRGGSTSSFHASEIAAAVFKEGLRAGLKAGADVLRAARAKDAAEATPGVPGVLGTPSGRRLQHSGRPTTSQRDPRHHVANTAGAIAVSSRKAGLPDCVRLGTPARASSPAGVKRRPSPKSRKKRPSSPTKKAKRAQSAPIYHRVSV